MKSTVTVLGMGYIGLPTALLFAKAGHKVLGFDVNEGKIALLRKGKLPFEEKGLKELFLGVKKKETFTPVGKLVSSNYYIISVPTPQEKHFADLGFVFSALCFIKAVFKDDQTIILESTVGPRDCEDKIIPFIRSFSKKFHFASCPERAIPGNTLFEMVNNARIIGGKTKEDAKLVAELYKTIIRGEVYLTNPTVASTCKVMENSFRDVNIALANEYAKIAEELKFNVWEAISLANRHPRVNILNPGPGVGGHCIPIDPWFLAASSKNADLLTVARNINDTMTKHVAEDIERLIKENKITKAVIGVLGYAYKKNVDDCRETPAKEVIRLLGRKYKILVNDPYVSSIPQANTDLHKLLTTVNIVVLLTNHDVYKQIYFKKYPNVLLVYDSHNLYKKENFKGSRVRHVILGVGK